MSKSGCCHRRPLPSQRPQPHLEDSSVYRQNRLTKLDKIKNLPVAVSDGDVDGQLVLSHQDGVCMEELVSPSLSRGLCANFTHER